MPSTAIQFRKRAYGKNGVQDFLRDVLAIANASIEDTRYIVTGVDVDAKGRKRLFRIDNNDFSGKPAYESLVSEHIEPPIRICYQPVVVDGERLGVFEIGDCQDRPYMMRVDHSETLRRGDAYMRVNDSAVKMGRRQLQALFEKEFTDSFSAANIEIGFPGDIIHKSRNLATCSLDQLPSAIASSKLKELVDAKTSAPLRRTNTFVDRLMHARLFGSDDPYKRRSTEEIMQEMDQIEQQYHDHDQHFLFEEQNDEVQLVVYNQGEEPIRDASLSLVMPTHDAFHVATELPKVPRDGGFAERTASEKSGYPAVTLADDAVKIVRKLGDVPPGEPVAVFDQPLRICVGSDLMGRRIGIQYSLIAQNLRAPAKGKLRLLF